MAQTDGSQKSVTVSQKTFSLPQGWTVQVSKKYPDRVYYFNTVTGVATWNLSDLVQSSGTSKSKKKKHHSRHKKHDQRLGNDQEQKQQHQQPIEIDDFDEEFDLDLTCAVEPEFDIGSSDMYGSEVSQQFESDLNRTDKKSSVDRPKRNKEKWKKLWDLPSGLKPEAKSSSPKEDCSISAEELQIIRFPKSNHIEGHTSIGVNSNVTEKTNLSQETSATSLGTDTKMGNTFNRMRSVEDLSQAAVSSRQQSVSSLKDGKQKKPNSSLGKSSVEVEFESGKRTGGKQIIDLRSTENKCCDKVQGKSGTIVEYKQGVKAYAAQGAKPVKKKTKPNSSAFAISPFIPRVLATNKSASTDTFSQVTGEVSEVNKCGGSTVSNVTYTGTTGPAVTVNALRTGQRRLGDSENLALNLQNLKNKSSASVGAHNKVSRSSALPKSCSPGEGASIDRKQDDASVSATLEWLAAAKARSNNKDLAAAQASQDESKARRLKGKQKSHSDLTDSSQFESEGIPAQTCTASSFSSGIPAVAVSRIAPHQLRQSEEPRSSAFSLVQPRSTHSTSVPSTQGNLVNNRSRSQSPPLTSHDTLGHSGIGNRKRSSRLPSRWHQTPESSVVSSVTSIQAESGSSVTLNQIHNAFPITPDSAREACVSSSAQEIDVDVAMEIDYDDLNTDQIMQDLQELRETIKPQAKAVGVLTESVQRTQTSRPITPVSALSSSPKRVYIVVDTNILISDLDFLQHLRDAVLKDYGRPYLIIPWMVLQELDGLKRSRGPSVKAQNAVRYLHSCLIASHPRVRGQTPAEASEKVEELQIKCNDDHLLKCCLQWQKKYEQVSVMLLTNDMNLENKAVVMGIKSFDTKRLKPLMCEASVDVEHPAPLNGKATGDKRSATGDRRSGEVPRQTSPPQNSSGLNTPVSTTNIPRRKRNIHQCRQETTSPANDQTCPVQTKAVDELLCKAKAVLKSALQPFVEKEMKDAYGEIWLDIVYRKPPWDARDLVAILLKHWIAVFGQKLDRSLNDSLDHLEKGLHPNAGARMDPQKLQGLLLNSLSVVSAVNRHSPCEQSVKRIEHQVKDLLDCLEGSPWAKKYRVPFDLRTSSQSSSERSKHGVLSSAIQNDSHSSKRPFVTTSSVSASSSLSRSSSSVSPVFPRQHRRSDESTEEQNVKKMRRASDSERQASQELSNSSHQRTSPQLCDMKHQIPEANTAEQTAAIGNTFQAIWGTIFNCCSNVETMLGRLLDSSEVTTVKDTLGRLVPVVSQLQSAFKKCLSFSPCVMDHEVESFSVFCSCLNTFFVSSNIPYPPLSPIDPGNMIVFMRSSDNRITLFNGSKQLDSLLEQLQTLVSRLPH